MMTNAKDSPLHGNLEMMKGVPPAAPTPAAMRAAKAIVREEMYASGGNLGEEYIAQIIDGTTGLPALLKMRDDMIRVVDALEGGGPYVSQQGQGMDGISALANFRAIATKAKGTTDVD